MKTSSTRLENFRAEIVVTLPLSDIDNSFNEKLEESIKDMEVPGFRKGKAPRSVLIQQIDQNKLRDTVINDVIEETLSEAFKNENLSVLRIIQITKDKIDDSGEFTYRATVELMPEIPDFDYKGIPIKVHKREITDELIDQNIENFKIQIASSNPIKDRGAVKGDWAAIEVTGFEFARIKLPGQSDEPKMLFKTQLGVELGGKRGIPWLDNEIIGMRVGESKTSYVTMPKNFISPPLEDDMEIEARIVLQWLEEKTIPELTDDFLSENGIAKDVEELKKKIRDDLENQARYVEDQEAVEKIQDWLIDNVKFDVPNDVLEEKKDSITERFRQEFQKRNDDLDIILKRVDEKASKVREEINRLAEGHARLDFIINKVAEKEELEVTQEELINHIQLLAQYSELKKHQVKKLIEDEYFLVETYRSLLTRKVTNFILNHAKREYIVHEEGKHDEHEEEKHEDTGDSGIIIAR